MNPEGADRPLRSPVPEATLKAARVYRPCRIREQLAKHDVAGILLYDSVNIRCALDSSNMGVWSGRNASRYALILNGGPAILWDYKAAKHLARDLEGVDEGHPAIPWIHLFWGERTAEKCEAWADEIMNTLRAHAGPRPRLAVDKPELLGLDSLRARGVTLVDGHELTARARSIKSSDEITLMRRIIRFCEAGVAAMAVVSESARSETEVWAALHHENARSGGEWIETKLCVSGLRKNPWYQECSEGLMKCGDMIAFDTDMISPAASSRAWWSASRASWPRRAAKASSWRRRC